jgi:hypothetical protein
MIFVHRDAETASLQSRQGEIGEAGSLACESVAIPCAIAVVPVRMIEAWLLFDEQAIRAAACNPNGSIDLGLPRLTDAEDIPDPKNVLRSLILDATGLGTRRRERFNVSNAVQRIPQYIDDFSPLRGLSAFGALEERLLEVLREQQWHA